ncbi:MAG: hypothetical protein WAP23_04325 [Candidatus Spechtbacterales bacterium]
MKAPIKIFVLAVLLSTFTIQFTSCSSSPDIERFATPSPASIENAQVPKETYLEKVAKDMGITKDEKGHLLVEGSADIQFLRLLTYFNTEAKNKRDQGDPLVYKVSGLYAGSTGSAGYADTVGFRIQVSSDDFATPVDLTVLARDLGISVSDKGRLTVEGKDVYANLTALLEYRNAEAANLEREYKIKAWYDFKEKDGTLVLDRVDILIHFSFAEKLFQTTPDLAVFSRNISAVESRQKSIIAMIAIDLAQLLQKPGELNIVATDFSGDNEQGPEMAYVFEAGDIGILKEIHAGKKEWDTIEILSLAEVKQIRRRYIAGDSLVDRSDLNKRRPKRDKEPVGAEAASVIAYIAQETARVINPTNLEIVVYEFKGNAPTQLTTWSYAFEAADIKTLRSEELSAKDILKIAIVTEQIGVIPGDRTIPEFKPIIR